MFLLRLIYFLTIGWWFGGLAALAGYLLCSSIIGLPIGVLILNRLPTFVFLREEGEECPYDPSHRHPAEELPFILRVIWFFVIGWALGVAVLTVGYVLLLTVIGIPIGLYLLNRVPKALTLSMHYG
ncbi:YccF domain-containing protein [Sulfidibacter corallicola]|uniref:YccF domain-containing protein n=1 Tax=Sulfidibacter corallicola TaxID=2818388 RepID=A0A8A4TTV6_SULCO|nr:YccF domain-containing protein [Sulfidibacter corallicola]QTD52574.1 hypothetical protein J3U87_08880 [Sulfidibacter corallicola]